MDMPRPWREMYEEDQDSNENGIADFSPDSYMQDEIDELRAYVAEIKKASIIEIAALRSTFERRNVEQSNYLRECLKRLNINQNHAFCLALGDFLDNATPCGASNDEKRP